LINACHRFKKTKKHIAIALEDIKQLLTLEFKHSKAMTKLQKEKKDGLKQIRQKKYHENEKHCQGKWFAFGVSKNQISQSGNKSLPKFL
jgi:hypothetical protein